MEELILQTYRDLKSRLLEIEAAGEGPLTTARRCLETTIYELAQLKKNIDPGSLTGVDSQIRFYKGLFPAYFSEVLYYRKLINLESAMQTMGSPELDPFVAGSQEEIGRYLHQHQSLLEYTRSGKKHLDEILFTQASDTVRVYPDTVEYSNTAFFNFNSFTISKLLAYERASLYLARRQAPAQQEINCATMQYNAGNIKGRGFRREKADIDKKLSWLEQRLNPDSTKMYLPWLRQRLARRKASISAVELLLLKISEQGQG